MQKIILNRNIEAKCWTALFFRVPNMPAAQELPLPWSLDVLDPHVVADDLYVRFPKASIWWRYGNSSPEYIGIKA